MSNIERLDFSKPPPGYSIDCDAELWFIEDDYHLECGTSETWDKAVVASWAHYKLRHDPPGMWSGYCAVLPLCDQFRPRMGVSIPGVAHLELYVNGERPGTCEEAKAMGRAAAWDHYVDAVEVAELLDGENGPAETWPQRCAWPIPMRWSADERASVRAWATGPGHAMPEVLRAL